MHRAAGDDDGFSANADVDVLLARARIDGLPEHALTAPVLDPQPVDAHFRHATRAVFEGPRHVTNQGGLFRARRATGDALVGPDTSILGAVVRLVAPPEASRAFFEQAAVLPDGGRVLRLGVNARLHSFEECIHRLRSEVGLSGHALPLHQYFFGCSPRHAAVDDRAASDAAALGVGDWRAPHDHGPPGVAKEARDRLGQVRVEARGRVVPAFFDEEHVMAGFGELCADDSSTRAGADHDDVRVVHFLRPIIAVPQYAHDGARWI